MAWTPIWDNSTGELTLQVDGPDQVELTVAAGDLRVNGGDIFLFGGLSAADVKSLNIKAAGEFDNNIDLSSLSGLNVPQLQSIDIDAGPGNDVIFASQIGGFYSGGAGNDSLHGGLGVDELIVDYQNFPRLTSLPVGDSGPLEPLGGTHGKDFGTISFSEIETLTEQNVGQTSSDLVITGTGGDDQLYVRATGPDSGTFRLDTNGNFGPVVSFAGITSFTFNAGDGEDTFQTEHPTNGLFLPTNGVTFEGGDGFDDYRAFSGSFDEVWYSTSDSTFDGASIHGD